MQHAVDYSVKGPVQSGRREKTSRSSKRIYSHVGQAENALRALPVEPGAKKIGLEPCKTRACNRGYSVAF